MTGRRGARGRLVPALTLGLTLGLAGGLAGCADQKERYCDTVEEHQQELGEVVADGGPGALIGALDTFEDLADEAPRDIQDEWQQVISRLRALENALEDAGVEPEDYRADEPPEGLEDEELGRIRAAADDLASPATAAALEGLQQQSLDVCKTPLSL